MDSLAIQVTSGESGGTTWNLEGSVAICTLAGLDVAIADGKERVWNAIVSLCVGTRTSGLLHPVISLSVQQGSGCNWAFECETLPLPAEKAYREAGEIRSKGGPSEQQVPDA